MGKSIIITGATGTAGSQLLREALADNEISSVTVLVRRPLDIQHPKLKVIIHPDFLNYTGLEGLFKNSDACIWCLGISQALVSKEEYIKITYDYALAAAKAMSTINPQMTFVFLSGMGADSREKSRVLFAWVKGKTENALKALPFKHFYIARPGGIIPTTKKANMHFKEKASLFAARIMGAIVPSTVITSSELGRAMLNFVKNGSDKVIHENKELKKRISA